MFDVVEWLNQRIPFPIFYTLRLYSVAVTLVFGFLWVVYGYDSTTATILLGIQGIGIHLSTIQLLAFTFWTSLTNLQVGGFKSLRHLASCFVEDVRNIGRFPVWNREKLRAYVSSQPEAIDPMRGFLYAFFLTLGCLFVFEVPYVLLHDYFNYGGDPMWPIYAFIGVGEVSMVARNFGIMFFAALPPLVLWSSHSYGVRWWRYRFNKKWGVMVLAMLGAWIFWTYYPFVHEMGTYEVDGDTVNVWVDGRLYETREFDKPVEVIAFPKQELFPQTIYTYYIVGEGEPYRGADDMGEFYVPDMGIRTVNLLLKYFVFLTVSYPLMVYVRNMDEEELEE